VDGLVIGIVRSSDLMDEVNVPAMNEVVHSSVGSARENSCTVSFDSTSQSAMLYLSKRLGE